MGVVNAKTQMFRRLECKNLDASFVARVREGLNCSPFEAEAVLKEVHAVYGSFLGETPQQQLPGCISLTCTDADEPAGKPIDKCQQRVYINGQLAFEHTVASTGLPVEILWNKAFVFDARPARASRP